MKFYLTLILTIYSSFAISQNEAAFEKANKLFDKQEYDLALIELEKLEKLDPENSQINATMGFIYDKKWEESSKQKYLHKAERNFKKALKKDRFNFDACYSLGRLYYKIAGEYANDVNKLTRDRTGKYETAKNEMNRYLAFAYPYFCEALLLRPNDIKTQTALKQIKKRIDVSNLDCQI